MPVREYMCSACNSVQERYMKRWDAPPPPCPQCGAQRIELASRFNAPFMGSIHKYVDPNREGAGMDGFWCYRKLSSASGNPEPVYISNMSQLKEFNRLEGLSAPGEVPTNCTMSSDGRRILSDGMPGNWSGAMPGIPARLQEIIDAPAEAFKPAGATAAPAMPANYGIKCEITTMPEAAA